MKKQSELLAIQRFSLFKRRQYRHQVSTMLTVLEHLAHNYIEQVLSDTVVIHYLITITYFAACIIECISNIYCLNTLI